MNTPRISIVSPVYYGEKIVEELVSRNVESVGTITDDYEIILVNDASPDDSCRAEIASEVDGQTLAGQKELLKDCFDLVYVFANHGVSFFGVDAKLVDEKVVYALSDFTCTKLSSALYRRCQTFDITFVW